MGNRHGRYIHLGRVRVEPHPTRRTPPHAASGVSELLLMVGGATPPRAPIPTPAAASVESASVESALASPESVLDSSTSFTSLRENLSLSTHGGELEYARWLLGRNAGVGWAVSLAEVGSELGFEISCMCRNCANLERGGEGTVRWRRAVGRGCACGVWGGAIVVAVHAQRWFGRLVECGERCVGVLIPTHCLGLPMAQLTPRVRQQVLQPGL